MSENSNEDFVNYNVKIDMSEDTSQTKVLRSIRPDSTVLEFGPAHGAMTEYLKSSLNCDVYIVEYEENYFKEAMRFAVDGYCGDASELKWFEKFSQVKFDHILFSDVLEHIYEPKGVLEKAVTLLKRDGRVHISVPNIAHNAIIIDLIQNNFEYREWGLLDKSHIRFFTYNSLFKMLDVNGLIATIEDATYLAPKWTEHRNDYDSLTNDTKILKHKQLGEVYQFVFEAVKKDYYYENKDSITVEKNIVFENRDAANNAIIFLDTGRGFNGDEVVIQPYVTDDFECTIELTPEVKAIRFDPTDSFGCVVKQLEIRSDVGLLDYTNVNGKEFGDHYLFLTKDPQFLVEIPTEATWVSIKAVVYLCDNEFYVDVLSLLGKVYEDLDEQHIISKHKDAVIAQRDEMVEEKNEVIRQRDETIREKNAELEQLQQDQMEELEELLQQHNAYNSQKQFELDTTRIQLQTIQNAFWWRLTKPARAMTRCIKWMLRSIPVVRLLYSLLLRFRYGKVNTNIYVNEQACDDENAEIINIYAEKAMKATVRLPKKVTAVIPNYNYAEYIIERIDSILMQSYPVYEVIIIDDNSTDNSVQVIEEKLQSVKHKNIRFVKSEVNSGNVFKQWKKAFELASGDYVWIAEADDSCNPRFLEALMTCFDDNEVVIAYCETLIMDKDNRVLMRDLREWIDIHSSGKWNDSYVVSGQDELCSTMCVNNTIANVSGAIIKQGDYRNILDAASKFHLAGDWYFYSKLLETGKIAYHCESLNYHRMHEKGVTLTTDNKREYQEICRVQDEILENHDVSEDVKKKVFNRREHVRQRFNLQFYDRILSIIIPVYNTEKYLQRCLESAIDAAPNNSEIIIVNDGSTDGSEKVINKFLNQYPDIIRYFKKANGGLANTKNFALEKAKGEFITFLDSDDYVDKRMYKDLLFEVEKNYVQIAVCDMELVFECGKPPIYKACSNQSRRDSFSKVVDTDLMTSSCNKIVHRSLFDGLSFPEGINNEDVAVTPILYSRANNIAIVKKPHYKYLQRDGSIMNSEFGEQRFAILETSKLCIDRLIEDCDDGEKIEIVKGSLYVHQILALVMHPIRMQKHERRYALTRIFMEKVHVYFPDIFTNSYVLELKTLYPSRSSTYIPTLFYLLRNRLYRLACIAFSCENRREKKTKLGL